MSRTVLMECSSRCWLNRRERQQRGIVGWGATVCASAELLACFVGRVDAEVLPSLQGSAAVTSDYIVQGVSHSDDQAELQFDVHAVNSSGFFGGLFASTAQFEVHQAREVEYDPYLGYGWQVNNDWRARVLTDSYVYPRRSEGSGYHYESVAFAVTNRDWMSVQLSYSPDTPRVSRYAGLLDVPETSVEFALIRPVFGRLMATAGIGHSHLDGRPDAFTALNYVYWNIGADYELTPVSLTASYIGTSASAKTLYYNGSGGGRWVVAVIWRF